MSEAIVKALLRRHPEYEQRKLHWEFLRACYEGGREWFDCHLFQYWKEGDDEFKARKNRAYRFNHSREVVDLVNKYLFRAPIARGNENVGVPVTQFWRRATKQGQDISYLMRQVSKTGSTSGRAYVVVDTTRRVEGVVSVRDAVAAGLRAYAYVLDPVDALDMSFDDNGELNWIVFRETARDDADFVSSTGEMQIRYRLWTRMGWRLWEMADVTKMSPVPPEAVTVGESKYVIDELDFGAHNLGVVPVVIYDNVEHDSQYYAPALINDIAYQDRAVANYLSNLDAIIQDQTFSQLAIPAQALMPGEEDAARERMLEMGTKRVFLWNAEAGVAPMFLSPDPKQAQIIITAIKQIINEIYHSVGLAGERTKSDNSMGIDNSSGVAKAFDFDRINALLTTKASGLQTVEQQIVALVMLWNSQSLDEGADRTTWVKYPTTFDVRGLIDELDMAQRLALISAPATVRRSQMRQLIEKLLPVLPAADRAAIETELKDFPVDPMDLLEDPLALPADPNKPTQGAVQSK
jgi:hypothetical protein